MGEAVVVGVLGPVEPAGRRGAASRRRLLAAVVMAMAAAGGGALLGRLAQPSPDRSEDFAFTAAAAIDTARRAEAHAQDLQRKLAAAQARVQTLEQAGAAQELADFQEAERLGVSRFMKDSTALWGDERRRVEIAIVREARRNGLDPLLVAAVIQVESSFNPYAVSPVGACGLMQLMPPTAEWLLERDIKAPHLFNPVLNIELGTRYLAQLMGQFGGDLNRALIAYNAGPSTARALRHGSPAYKRLVVYPKAVLATYKSLLTPPAQIAAR